MFREIYLDNSATTKPLDEVCDYINHINKEVYGNPSSMHTKGIEAERLIKRARESIARSLGVDSKEVYFTSGGTESNNWAILGFLDANTRRGKHVITTQIEHPSVLEVFKNLETKGYRVDYLKVDNKGMVDLEELRQKITMDTTLISIMYINNEIGAIQPIDEIVKIKNEINKDAVVHIDAVQAYGKIKILPKKLSVGMMSVSSHKIHGPKGVGALYVDRSVKIRPIIFGGGQESQIRSGTENVSGISGFGLAVEKYFESLSERNNKVSGLKKVFIKALSENIDGFTVISGENTSPYILNISFKNVKAEVLLHHLEERNIFVSTGSACSSRKNIHSHVLKAMGVGSKDIDGSLRFSFSGFNTEEDIIDTVNFIKEILPRIRYR
jgi:cysteine desulfurase